ncbi:MAG: HD domain-containing protein, partial [Chitinophagaceae bacterium]|nr:HD domain-containing protein [Chitinophagaceae bacterium]
TPTDPDRTFSDDPLRMMRAIRFAAQLGFTIEEKTWQGIVNNAHRISIITQERITEELNKMILAPIPSVGFDLLYKAGLLKLIFPQLVELAGAEYKDGHGHKDNFYHTLQVLDNLSKNTTDLWLRWAAILHDIAKPATKRFEKGHGWTFHGHEVVGGRMVSKIFTKLKLPLHEKMRLVRISRIRMITFFSSPNKFQIKTWFTSQLKMSSSKCFKKINFRSRFKLSSSLGS